VRLARTITKQEQEFPISDPVTLVEKNIHISAKRASTLSRLAHVKALSEDQLTEKGLVFSFGRFSPARLGQ
jgi:hypothetical protein